MVINHKSLTAEDFKVGVDAKVVLLTAEAPPALFSSFDCIPVDARLVTLFEREDGKGASAFAALPRMCLTSVFTG